MPGFIIDKVNYANVADPGQTFSFWYKEWDQPESSYVLIDSGVTVDADGNVTTSPLPAVTGLTEGQLYHLRAANECNSPLEYFTEQIQL